MSAFDHIPDLDDLGAHTAFLRRLARRLVGDEHRAEDLVQDALAVAVEYPPSLTGNIRTWLAGVLRNKSRMSARSAARRRAHELALPWPTTGADPAETAERLEVQRLLLEAVREVPEPFRTTLFLRFYDGLEIAEIAARLNVSAGTVRSRTSRAVAMLREKLDAFDDGVRRSWSLLLLPLAGGRGTATTGSGLALSGVVMTTRVWMVPAALMLFLFGAGMFVSLGNRAPDRQPVSDGTPGPLATLPLDEGEIAVDGKAEAPPLLPDSGRTPGAEGGRISGHVTFGGTMQAHRQVFLLRIDDPETAGEADPVVVTSGRDGRFRFEAVLPGCYRLFAKRPLSPEVTLEVTLVAGRDLDDLVLTFPQGRSLTVRVLDNLARPIREANVVTRTAYGQAIATTGQDGTTSMPGLSEEPVTIEIGAPPNPDGSTWWKKTVGPIVPEDQVIEVVLQKVALLRGTVLDPEGEPIAHMHVQAFDSTTPNAFVNARVTRADGTFEMTFPENLTIDLRVTGVLAPDGLAGEVTRTGIRGRLRGISAGSVPVTIRTDRIGMQRTLTVRVLDQHGEPVAGAVAFANNMARHPIPSAVSGTDGRAVIADLPEESHSVWVSRGEAELSRTVACPEMTFAVPRGQEIELRFRPGVLINGRVIGSDGEPVAGAEINLGTEGDPTLMLESTKTDEVGGFTVTGLPGRRHCVSASIFPAGTRGVHESVRDYVPDGEELVLRLETLIR